MNVERSMRRIRMSWTLCLITAIASGVLLGCERTQPVVTASADRPECPHAWSTYFLPGEIDESNDTTGGGRTGRNAKTWVIPRGGAPSAFLISREVSDVPEFHDCQRLVVSSASGGTTSGSAGAATASREYGEMTAVLVRDELDAVLVARLGNEGTNPIGKEGLPVAEIVSEGNYPPLGIQTGFNCVVLADSGLAWMIAMGSDHRAFRCDSVVLPAATPSNATLLSVSMGPRELDAAAVPPVTRWEWDSANGQQVIGIKCRPRVWCTVGPKGHKATSARAFAAGTGLPHVSGWIDEQYLAEVSPAGSTTAGGANALRVTPIVGTAYPAAQLGAWTMSPAKSGWTPVAYVALSAPLRSYETKWGFSDTPNASRGLAALNEISFCAGTQSGCGVPARVKSCSSPTEIWAKVTSPLPLSSGGNTTYLCVRYRAHAAIPSPTGAHFDIPPVVRWRWKADDEAMWVRCPAGCCEVYADT